MPFWRVGVQKCIQNFPLTTGNLETGPCALGVADDICFRKSFFIDKDLRMITSSRELMDAASEWLNQNKYARLSNLGSSSQKFGVNIPNIFELPSPR